LRTFVGAFLFCLVLSIGIGFIVIPLLRKLKIGQNILNYVTEHNYKSGTPTMGGVVFIVATIIGFCLFSGKDAYLSLVCIAVGVSYMVVGFLDDFLKIKLKRNEGLSAIQKTLFELAIALIISFFSLSKGLTKIHLPFLSEVVDLGWWFVPLCVFIFLASTNSVNLTDGLDGLAGGVSYIYFLAIAVIIALQINNDSLIYANANEYNNVAVLLFCLSGATLGFLLFNTHKATVFMGDTGSLSLGGFVAITAIVTGNILFIPIIGITFVLSSISVIIQVIYFKRTGKRVFLMAPLHHHFQHKGYEESKIAIGYKLVTLFFALISIISYL